MAEPTTRFRLIPQSTVAADINTTAKRLAAVAGESVKSTGAGNEADFDVVDISGGAANSNILTLFWDVTAHNGNTVVETFMLWIPAASIGFTEAASVVKVQPLRGNDEGAGPWDDTEQYVANAAIGDYTWATMVEAEPGAINVWPSDEGTSMDISGGASDDVVMWVMYCAIAANEVTGTYKGMDAGKELQFSFKYSFS
jgi:hypothetical protein